MLIKQFNRSHRHVRISATAHHNICFWADCSQLFNGTTYFIEDNLCHSSFCLLMYALDQVLASMPVIIPMQPGKQTSSSFNLTGIYIIHITTCSMERWADLWHNQTIIFFCDCLSCIMCINCGTLMQWIAFRGYFNYQYATIVHPMQFTCLVSRLSLHICFKSAFKQNATVLLRQ